MPPNVQRALAEGWFFGHRGSIRDIRHVVVLMQENRSFDHYFGTLAGVRGFDDPTALKLSTNRSVFYQPDVLNPWAICCPSIWTPSATSAQKIPSTSHAWAVQHAAWNGGRMDEWLPAHRKADGVNGPYVMGYYTRADIPFHFALAETFTLCDAYHCSVMGPTYPNRMHLMTGMIDADGLHGGPLINNTGRRMDSPGPPIPSGWNRLAFPGRSTSSKITSAATCWSIFEAFKQAPKGSPLYSKGMVRGPEGQFEYDAIHDKLPTVSWIIPTSFQSEHPDYMPADGAAFIASKIDAIAANPDVWAKTAFILNYDENDGIFDHVAPPVPPPARPVSLSRASHRRGISRPLHPHLALDHRRLGMQSAVRSHLCASVSGTLHRSSRTEHQPMAQKHLWRFDLGLPFPPCAKKISRIARYHHPVKPRQVRVNEFAQSRLSHCRPAASETGKRLPQTHLGAVYIQTGFYGDGRTCDPGLASPAAGLVCFPMTAGDRSVDSASFGHWGRGEFSAKIPERLWISPGFAHGFLVLS